MGLHMASFATLTKPIATSSTLLLPGLPDAASDAFTSDVSDSKAAAVPAASSGSSCVDAIADVRAQGTVVGDG